MTSASILAIDPGSADSAWVLYDEGRVLAHGKEPNDQVRVRCGQAFQLNVGVVAIEQIEPRYGLQAGWEVLDTARWVGRFEEASSVAVRRLKRSDILRALGVVTGGKRESRVSADAGVRAALIDRFGGGKEEAIGRKAAPGPLYGITADEWAALAVAVIAEEQEADHGAIAR